MDTQAPSPFAQAPARGGYPPGYGSVPANPYAQGYGAPEYPVQVPVAAAQGVGLADVDVVEAKKTHARGAMIYMLAWVVIAVSLPMLIAGIGLAIGAGGLSGTPQDILLAGLGLLAGGMAVRGVGFSLMMKADFIIRAHAWTAAGQR